MREPRRPDTIFWVDPGSVSGDRLTLDAEESHHLLRVHRALPGTPFESVDGAGNTYECLLESADHDLVIGKITARATGRGELASAIHLLVGLPDPGPSETVVLQAVPLGVSLIDFVASSHSGRPAVGAPRLTRLTRIAKSALKQSRRSRLPEIRSSTSWAEVLPRLGKGLKIMADPGGDRWAGPSPEGSQGIISLAVGPPGGFSEEEGTELRAAGFQPISLGNSRLTSDTAAITLLAVVRNHIK